MKIKMIHWDEPRGFERECNTFLEGKTVREIHIDSQMVDDGVLSNGQKRMHWYAAVAYEE